MRKRYLLEWLLPVGLLVIVAFVLIAFFETIPAELGWPIDWPAFSGAMRGGNLHYAVVDGLRPPPWSVLPLLPLGLVSMRTGWALLTLISLLCLMLSVPRRRWHWLSVLLLVVSFPAVRVVVDGNFEAIIVGGVALSLYSFNRRRPFVLTLGILLATIKPQAIFLLLVVLAIYLLRYWPRQKLFRFLALTGLIVGIAMLWRGQEWLIAVFGQNFNRYTGTLIDVTMVATLERLGIGSPFVVGGVWLLFVSATLYVALTCEPGRLSRTKAGYLIAGSLLAAPYAAGNSLLVPLAIGIIPLLLVRPLLAGLCIVLVNLLFLFNRPENINWLAFYNTALLLLMWTVFLWQLWIDRRSSNVFTQSKAVA